MRKNFPNLLTISRVAVIPVIILTFFIPFDFARWCATILFLYACLTDFLDGYLARKWNITSSFGRFLDPVADKLLVCSTLMMLVGKGMIGGASLIMATIILCREILVSGLREFLAELNVGVPVSWLAKWKTALQMTAIGCLLISNAEPWIPEAVWKGIGTSALWIAALLTLYTGFDYLKAASKQVGPRAASYKK